MRLRPPSLRDLDAVFAVIAARETADIGHVDYVLADLRDEWSMTEVDLDRDVRVVESEDGRILAYGIVRTPGALGLVDPDAEGRGAGTMLLDWLEQRESELGRNPHRQYVASGSRSAEVLLRARGYDLTRSNYRMTRRLDRLEVPAEPPPGVELRALDVERDVEAVHALDARAFATDPGYEPESLTAFIEEHIRRHDMAPELSLVAWRQNRLIGFLLSRRWEEDNVGYVDVLATHPEEQRQGVGMTLLLAAFARYADAGLAEAQLDVSSVNPRALRVYERAGMTPRFRYDIYERAA